MKPFLFSNIIYTNQIIIYLFPDHTEIMHRLRLVEKPVGNCDNPAIHKDYYIIYFFLK